MDNIPTYIKEWKSFKKGDVLYFVGVTWEGENPRVLSNARGLVIAEKGTDMLQVDFEGNVQFVHRAELSYKKRPV